MHRAPHPNQIFDKAWPDWIKVHPSWISFLSNLSNISAPHWPIIHVQCSSPDERSWLASEIHTISPNTRGPFISVDCSMLPSAFSEAQFFGFQSGFMGWGQQSRVGSIPRAHNGTLLLNQIDHLDFDFQSRLLNFLESHSFRMLGQETFSTANCQILSTSARNLTNLSSLGLFSLSLFNRITQVSLEIAPLSERSQLLPQLIDLLLFHIADLTSHAKPRISQDSLQLLAQYSFPGDVTELIHICLVACSESQFNIILPDHLPPFSPTIRHLSPTIRHLSPFSPLKSPLSPNQDIPNLQEIEILNYVHHHGYITNALCRKLLKIDRFRASYLLKKLHASNILVRIGLGRNSHYSKP